MQTTTSKVAATTFAVLFASGALAQYTSGISCSYAQWSINTKGESPCDVWGQLSGLCAAASVTPLTASSAPYAAPNGNTVNDCQCNSVAYNLMAACTWCQPGLFVENWLPQASWGEDCSNFQASGIQGNLDIRNITIPSWAFASIDGTTWNPVDAEFANVGIDYPNLQGSETEEDGFTSYTYNVPTSGPFSSGGNNTNTSRSGGSGIKIVPIAIGVGVGVVALLVLLLICCMWRRRSSRKNAQMNAPMPPPPMVQQQRPPSMQPYQGNPHAGNYQMPAEYQGGYAPPPGPPGAMYQSHSRPGSRPGSYVGPR